MVSNHNEISVVTTDQIVGSKIDETYGYVCSTYLTAFMLFKGQTVESALANAMDKLQYQAFKDGADAVVSCRTTLEMQSQFLLFTRVNVFMEGTMVTLK